MAQTKQASLLTLPQELLLLIPDYLHDLEDHMSLSSTCRLLRNCLESTSPHIILRLAAASSRTFFRPSPHFLVAATARQLGEWASGSLDNISSLQKSIRQGVKGLLDLAVQHCSLSMPDIRDLHAQRFATINPVTDLIDLSVGEQWYSTPNFWHGAVEDAYTIDVDPPETLFHLVIYGELFGPALNEYVESHGQNVSSLLTDINIRLDYVKYCIPDWASYSCQTSAAGVRRDDRTIDPRRAVEPIGPYLPFTNRNTAMQNFTEKSSQIGLRHMLQSPRWNPPWAALRQTLGGPDFLPASWKRDFSGDAQITWRQHLWESVVWYQGMDSMKLLRAYGWGTVGGKEGREGLGGMKAVKAKLAQLRARIEKMETMPKVITVGRQKTYEFPFLRGDLNICVSGYVPEGVVDNDNDAGDD